MKSLIVITMFIGIPFLIFSQSFTQGFSFGTESLVLDRSCWGDYDNDGDLDLLVSGEQYDNLGSYTSYTHLYRNDGGTTFTLVNGILPNLHFDEIYFADINGDNSLDIILSRVIDQYILYNNGNGTFVTDTLPQFGRIIGITDMNNDGKPDFITRNNNSISIVQNQGNDLFQTLANIDSVNYISGFQDYFDFNNDGWTDIISYDRDTIILCQNNGNLTFSKHYIYDTNPNLTDIVSHTFGDYDNDGDLDIALISWHNYYTHGYCTFFRNDGNANFTKVLDLTSTFGMSLDLMDIDNNGLLDVLDPGQGNSKTFLQAPAGTFTPGSLSLLDDNYIYSSVCDVNNDGKMDFLFTGMQGYTEHSYIYFNNAGTVNLTPSIPTNTSFSTVGNHIRITWDRSNDPESNTLSSSYNVVVYDSLNNLVVSSISDTSNGHRYGYGQGNAGTNNFIYFADLPSGKYYWRVQAIDNNFNASDFSNIDSFFVTCPSPPQLLSPLNESIDNSLNSVLYWQHPVGATSFTVELSTDASFQTTLLSSNVTTDTLALSGLQLSTNYYWRVKSIGSCTSNWSAVYKFTTVGIYIHSYLSLMPTSSNYHIELADLNNDGKLDLIYNITPSSTRYYTNNFPAFFYNTSNSASVGSSSLQEFLVNDFNKDNYIDFAIQTGGGNSIAFYNNNYSGFTYLNAQSCSAQNGFGDWADYDNDGDYDFAIAGNSGGTPHSYLFTNNNSGVFLQSSPFTNEMSGSANWADYDKDGDKDLLLNGTLYQNNNGAFTALSTGFPINSQFEWGDLNNDGYLDLVYTNSTQSGIYLNNTNGTFQLYSSTLPSPSGKIKIVDVNNDGWNDIILGGNHLYICLNQYNMTFNVINQNILCSSLSIGDVNQDNRIDLAVIGANADILINTTMLANTNPLAPNNLQFESINDTLTLKWSPGSDLETPANSLSYNVFVGNTQGGIQIVSPNSNLSTGKRLFAKRGNADLDTCYKIVNLTEGPYYWSVQSIDQAFSGSAFAAIDSIYYLKRPTLLTPINNQTNTAYNVSFTWSTSILPVTYKIQISDDINFSNIICDSAVSSTNFAYDLKGTLTTYYWRVKKILYGTESCWSQTWTFTTRPIEPKYPPDNSEISCTTACFIWGNIPFATTYRLLVSSDSLFSSTIFIDSLITDTFKILPGIINNVQLYWKVCPKYQGLNQSWSEIWSTKYLQYPNYFNSSWQWKFPLPVGNTLRGIFASDTNNVWIVGDDGTILHKVGSNWNINSIGVYNTSSTKDLQDISFANDSIGFACGSFGVIKTNNKGVNWEILPFPFSSSIPKKLVLISPDTLFILAEDTKLYQSTNSGFTWKMVMSTVNDISFPDHIHGFIATTSGYGYKTINCGLTWSFFPVAINPLYKISFVDQNNGYVVTSNTLLKTTNGGTSWNSIIPMTGSSIVDLQFISPTVGYQSSSWNMYKTVNGGTTWIGVGLPTTGFNGRIKVIDSNNLYYIGNNGLIYNTSNGGTNMV